MNRFRVSRLVLFLYDIARLFVIVATMTQLGKLSLFDGSFPYLVYASSQALFPIMTWFIYMDAKTHLAYIPLHITGKCIHIVLSGVWIFGAVSTGLATLSFDLFVCLGLTLIILFTDIISILGMFFVKRGFSVQDQTDIQQNNDENNSVLSNDIGGM
jgi:hypothetical protein